MYLALLISFQFSAFSLVFESRGRAFQKREVICQGTKPAWQLVGSCCPHCEVIAL